MFDIVAAGGVLFSVVVTSDDVAEQPFAPVTVTWNVPAVVTVIDCVVSPPGNHRYDAPAPAVKIVDGTAHVNASPLLFDIVAAGNALTVTVWLLLLLQPFPSV